MTQTTNERVAAMSVEAIVERITPDLAEHYLALNQENRALKPASVRKLAAAMLRGEWVLNGESIKFDENGTLIDGQHRLAAIVESAQSVDILVVRGTKAEAQDTVDLGARRSLSDALRIRQEQNHTALAAAIGWLFRLQGSTGETHDLNLQRLSYPTVKQGLGLLAENPSLRDSHAIARRAYSETRFPLGLGMALHYLFATIDAEDAEVFFDYLATGAGLDEEHPILALRHTIGRLQNQRPRPGQLYYAAIAIKAWNKFIEGVPVSRLRWSPGGAKAESFPKIRTY